MVDVQRSLSEYAASDVMRIVFPQHPRYEDSHLKVGKNEGGDWAYFEQACCRGGHTGDWRFYRKCTRREVALLDDFDKLGLLLRQEDGAPKGCSLVYYRFA